MYTWFEIFTETAENSISKATSVWHQSLKINILVFIFSHNCHYKHKNKYFFSTNWYIHCRKVGVLPKCGWNSTVHHHFYILTCICRLSMQYTTFVFLYYHRVYIVCYNKQKFIMTSFIVLGSWHFLTYKSII